MMQGWVFINSDGEYAVEGDAGGFATGKTIRWVANLHTATVFCVEEPWHGLQQRHCECLKKCQALQAESVRTVKLTPFK